MIERIDVLWLVEHVARELDVACAVKSLVRSRYGVDIIVRNIYLHANEVMREFFPAIVVFPFFYRLSDMAIRDYVEAWPDAIYFNLAFEEIFYKAHLKMKAPGDDFTRQRVIHHAWGDFYKNYLVENGVPSERIFVNGNPVYQLYKDPYKQYFKQRDRLANDHRLDSSKRWVFIPENYKWAFFSDDKLRSSAERGGNFDEYINMRAFCQESLKHVLQWCDQVSKDGKVEIIFRPRPATHLQRMEEFFRENVGVPTKHFHFIKGDTVREWIMASDIVISSISTSLIEAAVAGKVIYMVEPIPIPESLQCDWYGFVPRIHSRDEFVQACTKELKDDHRELQTWAQEKMLSNGDPIAGLANFIGRLVKNGGSLRADLMNNLPPVSFYKNLSIFSSVSVKAMRRFRRLFRYTGYAIHSLLSAVKVVGLHLASFLIPRSRKPEVRPKDTVLRKALDRLSRALSLFAQGFRDTNYFNPVTHENDEFPQAEVQARVEKWREILAND